MNSRTSQSNGSKENPSLVKEFLACQHLLSDEEISEFLSGGEQQDEDDDESKNIDRRVMEAFIQHSHDSCDEHFHLRQAFHKRRAEIRKLTADLRNGGARIDEDGRLVRVTEPPQPPRADLPPVNGDINAGGNPDANNNLQFDQQQQQQQLLPEQQEELFLEHKRREAEFTVAQAVQELRRTNQRDGPVPEEDFEVILLDHRGRPRVPAQGAAFAYNNNDDEQTIFAHPGLQRIAFGCFTMVALIVCIALKVLPISTFVGNAESTLKTFDPLLNEVLVTRNWKHHVRECSGGLGNRSIDHYDPNWFHRIKQSLYGNTTIDCSDGVLHIPSRHVLFSEMEEKDWRDSSVNVSWFMPCSEGTNENFQKQQCNIQEANKQECKNPLNDKDNFWSRNQCFRGIHDDFVGHMEIKAALNMGDYLIANGGDHFDIHYDPRYLLHMVPSILKKVACILDSTYLTQQQSYEKCLRGNARNIPNLWPVAFRVLTTGPMDGHDVKLKQEKGDKMTMYLTESIALNETNYLNWVLKSRRHNDKARYQSYYRPWPYRLAPKRETCDLKSDLQTDSRFAIQTSLYLTTGAGEDYWGGTDLFVDDHPSNFADSHSRIARGVSVDGTIGRLVVSTGGFENLKCRLPTRGGFRSVLQIWWDS